ncbi:ATP-grasp domain-containing protein [Sporosarcina sp. FSL K6-1522]|uniref:ATP-grasp domain-containing protein n=1 Tax=Sporosarcina sp. FSL K6-1522 TaxID=2921554 RepID=UPI00315A104C
MESILFIETATSGSSREAIKAATRLGYRTVLLTERMSFIKRRNEFADVAQMIYLEELTEDRIRMEICLLQQQGSIMKAIISFVDPFVSIAAQLANECCNAALSVEALKIMEDKTATRKALSEHATTPIFEIVGPTDDLEQVIHQDRDYPIIVKSAVSKASKDVYSVGNKVELEKAIKRIGKLYPKETIVLDEYVDGPQYLVEVLVHNGEMTIIAIIKQEITKNIKFIVTGYAVEPHLEGELYTKLVRAVESILKNLQVTNATCHLECRYVNENWKLIEMNPRIAGGAMNRMIEEAFGINLVEETLKLYLGFEPTLIKRFEKNMYTHYITIKSCGYLLKVIGQQQATAHPGVKEVYIKPHKGAIMMPPLSMGHRYGYVIASGDTPEEAKKNAENAASHIKFYLEPL